MCIILQATRNESDRRIIPLDEVESATPVGEDFEQFDIQIGPSDRESIPLFSRERDRILTEIAVERDRLPQHIRN